MMRQHDIWDTKPKNVIAGIHLFARWYPAPNGHYWTWECYKIDGVDHYQIHLVNRTTKEIDLKLPYRPWEIEDFTLYLDGMEGIQLLERFLRDGNKMEIKVPGTVLDT